MLDDFKIVRAADDSDEDATEIGELIGEVGEPSHEIGNSKKPLGSAGDRSRTNKRGVRQSIVVESGTSTKFVDLQTSLSRSRDLSKCILSVEYGFRKRDDLKTSDEERISEVAWDSQKKFSDELQALGKYQKEEKDAREKSKLEKLHEEDVLSANDITGTSLRPPKRRAKPLSRKALLESNIIKVTTQTISSGVSRTVSSMTGAMKSTFAGAEALYAPVAEKESVSKSQVLRNAVDAMGHFKSAVKEQRTEGFEFENLVSDCYKCGLHFLNECLV